MPWYDFEAMDQTGQVFRDSVEAGTQEEAETIIRSQGLFLTKLAAKKSTATAAVGKSKRKKTLALGGASSKIMCTFTRQLSILQDAGLPVLRSLKILESQSKAGANKTVFNYRIVYGVNTLFVYPNAVPLVGNIAIRTFKPCTLKKYGMLFCSLYL